MTYVFAAAVALAQAAPLSPARALGGPPQYEVGRIGSGMRHRSDPERTISTPAATNTSPSPALMAWAAMRMVCSDDEQ